MEHNEQNEPKEQDKPKTVSRRRFLANTGYTLGGVVLGGVLGGLLKTANKTPAPSQAAVSTPNFNQALMFFTPEQFKIVEAATERIFPADENGPGAKDLGVAFYIDHQLSGDWGFNARDYMQAPFYAGEKVQGYQGRLRRREIFPIAIQELQNYSLAQYKKHFTELTAEEQDAVLTAFEKDQVKITTISASGFFKMLRDATIEGAYADPLYGGNRNMDGWKMRNYPGTQMSYTQIIDKEFTKIPPKSLQDMLNSH